MSFSRVCLNAAYLLVHVICSGPYEYERRIIQLVEPPVTFP